jgi:uncharacterized phage protein (TIGR01671 family)
MREIKFRAWDLVNKKMFFPREISFGDEGLALTVMAQRAPRLFDECLVHGENIVLMQYTGLKDNAGKDIYEGDILKPKDYPINCVVRFEAAEFTCEGGQIFIDPKDWWKRIIIGNIFETPELVKP